MYSIALNFIVKGLILSFGLFGNLVVMIVFSSKAFRKFPSRNIYRILVVFDSFTLIYRAGYISLVSFGIIWFDISELICNLSLYLQYAFLTPYLLVFISVEKFIAIRYPSNKLIKNQTFQAVIVVLMITSNLIVFHPIFYLHSFKNQTTNTSIGNQIQCFIFNEESIKLIGILSIIYLAVFPFILMLIFSFLLVRTILKTRLRILNLNSQHDRNRLKKDMQFAISSIFMNLFYFLLYLPYCVYLILKIDILTDLFRNVFVPLAAINHCDHFYVLFLFNSVFRRQVLVICKLKDKDKRSKHNLY